MSNIIEVDDNSQVTLKTLIEVLQTYQRIALNYNKNVDGYNIFIEVDGKIYDAQSVRFNDIEEKKVSLVYRYTEPKVVFDSRKDDLN